MEEQFEAVQSAYTGLVEAQRALIASLLKRNEQLTIELAKSKPKSKKWWGFAHD